MFAYKNAFHSPTAEHNCLPPSVQTNLANQRLSTKILYLAEIESSARMSLSSLPRLPAMLQSSSLPYGARQLTAGQFHGRRAPSIGAPDVVLSPEPSASLKRRSHIRRSSRSGTSPTESNFFGATQQPVQTARPQLSPLVTAFVRSTTASSASVSVITRRPTASEPPVIEWRNAPRYQPKMTVRADISRRCVI